MVQLRETMEPIERAESPSPGAIYRQIGVRLWGGGAYERESIDGSQTQYRTLSRVDADDIVVNKIWARNGSVAVVPKELAGGYVSSEFPTFVPVREILEPRWFHWLTKTADFWAQCDEKSQGTSGKNRIRPERFLEIEIPLPPLTEQHRIVARIEELIVNIAKVRNLKDEIEREQYLLLMATFREVITGALYQRMEDIAPLVRRTIKVELDDSYPELGVRSFGRGTFHKQPKTGAELGSKRLFKIEPGDLVFNNVFAWEGAVAVVRDEDAGHIGSHRFITCVPTPNVATPHFLCFYFLTPEGLERLGEASPGGAGRNRTLGLDALMNIEVPIPALEKQVWFNHLQAKADELKYLHTETASKLDALIPAILDRAFKGEL